MSERDFEIGARKFKLNKIDPFKQFAVVRRLGPILGDIIPVAQKIQKLQKEQMSEDEKFESIALIASPVMNGLAKLSDDDANKVLLILCSAVEVQQQPVGNWARISNGDMLMIQEFDFPALMQIAGRAFQYNLAGFFASMGQTSAGAR